MRRCRRLAGALLGLLPLLVVAGCEPPTIGENSGYSPGVYLFNRPDDEVIRELDGMVAAGARWIRVTVSWDHVEAVRGVSDWSEIDRIVRPARDRGMNVLLLASYTPPWARPPGTTYAHPPTNFTAWGNFVRRATERYRPLGVRSWQIWNEPNIAAHFKPKPDPITYLRLLRGARSAIRAVDPGAVIVTGGMAPVPGRPDGTNLSAQTFLRRLYAAGAEGSFDAVGLHPHGFCCGNPAPPNPFSVVTTEVHQVMVNNGDGGKEIWGTEFGYPTGAGRYAYTEAEQARFIVDGFSMWHRWSFTGPLFLFSYRDAGFDPTDYHKHFGLVRKDFVPKQSLSAFREKMGEPMP